MNSSLPIHISWYVCYTSRGLHPAPLPHFLRPYLMPERGLIPTTVRTRPKLSTPRITNPPSDCSRASPANQSDRESNARKSASCAGARGFRSRARRGSFFPGPVHFNHLHQKICMKCTLGGIEGKGRAWQGLRDCQTRICLVFAPSPDTAITGDCYCPNTPNARGRTRDRSC